MKIFSISTPLNIELKFQLASFKARLGAWLIDFVVIYAYNLVMLIFLFNNLSSINLSKLSNGDAVQIGIVLLLYIPSTLYHLASQLIWRGRSLGKWLMHIKVVNIHDGRVPSTQQILLRNLLCIPNYLLGFCMIAVNPYALFGFLIVLGVTAIPDLAAILFQKQHQKIGDIIAGTLSVRTDYDADLKHTIFMEVKDLENYQIQYENVLQLTDFEINKLNNILHKKDNYDTSYLNKITAKIEAKIKAKNKQNTNLDFYHQLIQDYNYIYQQKK